MNQLPKILWIYDFDTENRTITFDESDVFNSSITLNSKYEPKKGDRIWFYPGCTIPRFKITQFCKKHDVAVVKNADKASVKFLEEQTITELTKSLHLYKYSKAEFITWLDSVMCNAYIELRNTILKYEDVYIDYGTMQELCSEDNFGAKVFQEDWYGRKNESVKLSKDGNSSAQLLNILNDGNTYYQDAMLELLNSSLVMDEKMYLETRKILESTDKENTKLAMEAMANCDFQRSAVYLLLLLREFGSKIYDSGARHHVNFKSLIKYFKITNISNISLDDIINSLRSHKILNLANLNMLMPMAMQQIKEEGEMENIKVKDLELTPEVEAAIAENILDQQTPPVQDVPEDRKPPEEDSHASLFMQVTEPNLDSI